MSVSSDLGRRRVGVALRAAVSAATFGPGPGGRGAQGDDLVGVLQQEAEQPLVLGVEAGGHRGQPGPGAVEGVDVDGHRDLEALAVVAQVDRVHDGHVGLVDPLGAQRGLGRGGELVEGGADLVVGGVGELADVRAGGLVAQARRRVAVGAEHAGARRDDDRPAAGELPEGVGVQRAGPAEGDEGEVAGVEALLDAHQPQRAEHVLVDDVDDAARGGLDAVERGGVGDGLHRGAGRPRRRG